MQSVLILTVSGTDRAGLVERLAETIAKHGANWEHCRMAHLADRFVGLLQVSVPATRQGALEADLRGIEDLEVTVAAGYPDADAAAEPSETLNLEVVGGDHPGIVRDVFAALAEAEVNVEELSTYTESAPETGGVLFYAKARLAEHGKVDRERIREKLEAIAQDIMVDVRLID